jgi:hypothetical protein
VNSEAPNATGPSERAERPQLHQEQDRQPPDPSGGDVERYINEMVRIDRQEEGEARAGKVAHLARRYGRIRQEIARLKAMDKALADAPDGQRSLTDPDARAMATSARHSGLVGYNVQNVVDTETHIIVTHDVTNQGLTAIN